MTMNFRTLAALGAAASLALGAAACGSDDEEAPATGGSSAAAQTQEQASAEPVAQIDDLSGGDTTKVTLDAGFVEALTSLNVTPGPVGDATISEQGVATFPITGGNVTYYTPGSVRPYVQGRVDHDGSGLSLSAGGTTVELTDFVVDPGASVLTGRVSVDGEVAAEDAPLFFLDGRTLEPLRTNADGSKAVLEGTTVKLRQEAADLLNQTFGIDDLQRDLVIGVAKITVDTGA
jgi:hypothetical protein